MRVIHVLGGGLLKDALVDEVILELFHLLGEWVPIQGFIPELLELL